MYLYLVRDTDVSYVFHDIHLEGGYLPCIGSGNGVATASTNVTAEAAGVEPAMWFKVVILDHVTVDCSQKVLKWSMQSLGHDAFSESLYNAMPRTSRHLYLEGEYDNIECSLDALFEAAVQLADAITSNSPDAHALMMTFLTDLVLPEIKITRDDEDTMQAALLHQMDCMACLDMEIDSRANKINRLKQTLKDFRLAVVEDFVGTEGKLKKARPDLFSLISSHLERDIEEARGMLRIAQLRVGGASARADAAQECETARERLADLESARDRLVNKRPPTNIKAARKDVLTSQSFVRDRKPIHDLYAASSQVLDVQRRESSQLLEHKVAAMSVKEAMRSVLQDLCCVEETLGYEQQSGTGRLPTDIRQQQKKASLTFTSIVEKVRAIVSDRSHPAGACHENFCSMVEKLCGDAMLGQPQHDVSPQESGDNAAVILTTPGDYEHVSRLDLAETCELLQKVIVTHCADIVSMIDFSDDGGVAVTRKKRLCYEYYMYERLGETLLALFVVRHAQDTGQFVQDMKMLTCDDLSISEKWQLELFQWNNAHQPQQNSERLETTIEGVSTSVGCKFDAAAGDIEPVGNKDGADGKEPDLRDKRVGSYFVEDCSERSMPIDSGCTEGSQVRPDAEHSSSGSWCSSDVDAASLADSTNASGVPPVILRSRARSNKKLTVDGSSSQTSAPSWVAQLLLPTYVCLEKMSGQPSPLAKLQLLTRSLRLLATIETQMRRSEERGGRPPSTCSDDLISVVTLVLLRADASLVAALCVQLKFVEAFMDECLQSGVHAFSLATFEAAVWHLRDIVLMKRQQGDYKSHKSSRRGVSGAATRVS